MPTEEKLEPQMSDLKGLAKELTDKLGSTARHKRKTYRHKDLPLFNREQVNAALQAYDRRPFLDLLTTWIEQAPDPEAIRDFADAHPDRWANALASIAKIGGFTEKKEVAVDLNLNIRMMSDSQLEDKLAEIKNQLIEGEAIDVTEGNPGSDEASSSEEC